MHRMIKSIDWDGIMSLKVSLVLTTYNRPDELKKTMLSIQAQDYNNIEVVIKDGGSEITTVEMIKKYANNFKYPVIYISEKDAGIYDALNKGIEMSTGDIVAICNDILTIPNAISLIVETMEKENTDGVHADLVYATNNKVVRYWHMGQGDIRRGWMPGHPTLYLKRSIYTRYGLYDTDYTISADFEFMIRILRDDNIRLSYIPHVLVRMFYGGTSTNSKKAYWISIKESYKALKQNNIHFAWILIFIRTIKVIQQFKMARKIKIEDISCI